MLIKKLLLLSHPDQDYGYGKKNFIVWWNCPSKSPSDQFPPDSNIDAGGYFVKT